MARYDPPRAPIAKTRPPTLGHFPAVGIGVLVSIVLTWASGRVSMQWPGLSLPSTIVLGCGGKLGAGFVSGALVKRDHVVAGFTALTPIAAVAIVLPAAMQADALDLAGGLMTAAVSLGLGALGGRIGQSFRLSRQRPVETTELAE